MFRKGKCFRKLVILGGPILLVVALASVAFGCTGEPKEKEQVSLRTDFLPFGYQAPFFWALEKGYYSDENLEVTITDGAGSGSTVQVVGSGTSDFGFVDASVMIQGISQDISVKAVATIWPSSNNAVFYLKESGIKSPKDLEGKKFGFASGSAQETMWPAIVSANGIDEKKVTVVNIDMPAKLRMLREKKVDFLLTQSTPSVRFKAQGVEVDHIFYKDIGLPVVGYALITQPTTIKGRPDMVRGFVKATLRAWKEAKDKPDEMVDVMKKHRPDLPDTGLAELKANLHLLESPDIKNRSYGWSSEKEWQATVDVLAEHADMPRTPALGELITNEFIP